MITIAYDKAGCELVKRIAQYFDEHQMEYTIALPEGEDYWLDYPDGAFTVAKAVAEGKSDFGLLICGTGIGMSMAANKINGVRAALCSDTYSAAVTRQHNNANVLCIGARVTGEELALCIVDAFFNASFEGGRHARRVDKITAEELSR